MKWLAKLTIFISLFSCASERITHVPKPRLDFYILDSACMATNGSDVLGVEALTNFGCLSPKDLEALFTYLKGLKSSCMK